MNTAMVVFLLEQPGNIDLPETIIRRIEPSLSPNRKAIVEWGDGTLRCASNALVTRFEELLQAAEIPRRLSNHRMPRSAIATLAAEASRQWTATFNPRAITAADFMSVYEQALSRIIHEPRDSTTVRL